MEGANMSKYKVSDERFEELLARWTDRDDWLHAHEVREMTTGALERLADADGILTSAMEAAGENLREAQARAEKAEAVVEKLRGGVEHILSYHSTQDSILSFDTTSTPPARRNVEVLRNTAGRNHGIRRMRRRMTDG